ncbi:MAG: serine/threonine-protein kinase [Vicinamibacterales bacterium]
MTRLSAPASPPPVRPPSSASSRSSSSQPSGLLSSTSSIDHGRFPPGTLLGGRYRIVGRLGKGGMGEVFRADDLKLGQSVALKFLPSDVDRDPARLTQLHTEVRMARQVSHPNVCRVYDIDEVEGHTFLSMEYVDGEDLSSLLRRIGRFPQDRALEVARQICAGLAAAHERGVVHRDFKPANVMLDGAGKVRVTDFGLAGVSGETIRAGTPAYMAPEQLAGGEVTVRSDIYALGLVLYEVFTGQRALEGRNLAELINRREQSGITPPSALVKDLDPDIERGIMRCLRPEPEARPASALAVAASLPGGDPLAAALAAGETPSPAMVAAAGMSEAMSARHMWMGAAWIACALVLILIAYQRILLVNRVPIPKPPEALADRAEEALAKLGYTGSAQSAAGLGISTDYLAYIDRTSTTSDRWKQIRSSRPESVVFWYRTSPRLLIPWGNENTVAGTNPPLNISGMTLAVLDASGRLAEFHAVPEPIESPGPHGAADWTPLFEAAALDLKTFRAVTPERVPLGFADERAAWEGQLPDRPDLTFRIEAAAYHGRVTFFGLTGPWTRSARADAPPPSRFNQIVQGLAGLIMPGLMIAGALLARHNRRLHRGDLVGAARAASFLLVVGIMTRALLLSHTSNINLEVGRLFSMIGAALFDSAVLWVTYLGLEPYVRRTSPDSLIGWTRLVSGRWNDPHVGRDVLIGVSAGLLMTLLFPLYYLLPPLAGYPEPMPVLPDLRPFMGMRYVIGQLLAQVPDALTSGMLGTVGLASLLLLLKRRTLAVAAAILMFTPVAVNGMFNPGYPLLALAIGAGIISIFVWVIVREGLLPAIVCLATHFILLRAPLTMSLTAWWAPAGWCHLGAVALLGFGACYVARYDAAPSAVRRYEVQGA